MIGGILALTLSPLVIFGIVDTLCARPLDGVRFVWRHPFHGR